jgi:hypothetical protein
VILKCVFYVCSLYAMQGWRRGRRECGWLGVRAAARGGAPAEERAALPARGRSHPSLAVVCGKKEYVCVCGSASACEHVSAPLMCVDKCVRACVERGSVRPPTLTPSRASVVTGGVCQCSRRRHISSSDTYEASESMSVWPRGDSPLLGGPRCLYALAWRYVCEHSPSFAPESPFSSPSPLASESSLTSESALSLAVPSAFAFADDDDRRQDRHDAEAFALVPVSLALAPAAFALAALAMPAAFTTFAAPSAALATLTAPSAALATLTTPTAAALATLCSLGGCRALEALLGGRSIEAVGGGDIAEGGAPSERERGDTAAAEGRDSERGDKETGTKGAAVS